ncbi:hypothetical protein Tco_0699917 [Tanacetum coccineum]
MYPSSHPSQPQISHSSVPPSQQYQSHINHQTSSVIQIAYHLPQASTQPMTEFSQIDSSSLQPTINLELPLIRETRPPFKMAGLQCNTFKGGKDKVILEKEMLAEVQEARQILDGEQLAFLADPGIPDGQAAQATIPKTTAFQTEDLDAYDYDCNDVTNAKAV